MRLGIDPLDGMSLERTLEIARGNKLVIEIQMEPPIFSWKNDFRNTIKGIAEEFGLVLHAPYREVFLASIHPSVRRGSVRTLIDSIDLAKEVGAEILVTHAGNFNRKQDRGNIWELFIPSFVDVLDHARDEGVLLALENVVDHHNALCVAPSDFLFLYEEVGEFPICLDIAHAYSSGNLDAFLDLLGDRVIAYHLSDTIKGKDLHRAVGEGEIPWKSVLSRTKKDAVYILEVWGEAPTLQSLERLRRMISELNHG